MSKSRSPINSATLFHLFTGIALLAVVAALVADTPGVMSSPPAIALALIGVADLFVGLVRLRHPPVNLADFD